MLTAPQLLDASEDIYDPDDIGEAGYERDKEEGDTF